MTRTEFEERIAKAHGPEFRKAQNGEPVFADGRNLPPPPTSSGCSGFRRATGFIA
jgi:hypothetical protein